jgi:hypothetical protein
MKNDVMRRMMLMQFLNSKKQQGKMPMPSGGAPMAMPSGGGGGTQQNIAMVNSLPLELRKKILGANTGLL